MPRISMFFGIVIFMYYDDHNPPHFHALYEGLEAIFDLDGNIMKGFIAPRAARLIQEWTETHKADLRHNWDLAMHNMPLNWIEPLK